MKLLHALTGLSDAAGSNGDSPSISEKGLSVALEDVWNALKTKVDRHDLDEVAAEGRKLEDSIWREFTAVQVNILF